MKKLALTTAIALALSTAAYAAGPQHSNMGGNFNMGSSGGGKIGGSPGAPSSFNGPGGPGFSGTTKGAPGGLYSQGNVKSFNQNGPYKSGGNKFYGNDERFTKQGKGSLYNYKEHDHEGMYGEHHEGVYGQHHEGMYGEHHEGIEGRDHHGVVSGNFFEHGRHFHFRRFFHGEWVFLNDWDDCTAYAWVHVAPGAWAWVPVDICVG